LIWEGGVKLAQSGKPTTPLTWVKGFEGALHTSLKQIWRPWDWRLPRIDVNYLDGFLSEGGEVASMMNGKVLLHGYYSSTYVYMFTRQSNVTFKDGNGNCKFCTKRVKM